MSRDISFCGDLFLSFPSFLSLAEGCAQFKWAVTISAPREHKKEETIEEKHWRRVRASLNGRTHLQVRSCRGQSVSSSGGGSGGRCPWQVPRSGAGGGRDPLERGKGTGSAGGGRRRGISLLPLHLEEKQRNTGVSERKGRVILLDTVDSIKH